MSISVEEAKKRINALIEPYMGGKAPDYLLMDHPEYGRGLHCGDKETWDAIQREKEKIARIIDEYLN